MDVLRRNLGKRAAARVMILLCLALVPGAVARGEPAPPVRPPAIAGTWYPARRSLAEAEIDRLVREVSGGPALDGRPIALVVPHAGWRYSGFAAAAAFATLRPGDFERVVIVGPSHHVAFDGYALPAASAFRTPLGDVPLCRGIVKSLDDGRLVRTLDDVHLREHSIEIELPFLQERLDRFCVVPILVGSTDPAMQRDLAARLARLHDRRTLFVFSSDFTHYGPAYQYVPFGLYAREARDRIRALDQRALEQFAPPDAAGFRRFLQETSATICGREGLLVLLELLPRIAPQARAVRLAQYASVDLPGMEENSSVSYVALAYVAGAPGGATPGVPPLGPPPPHPVCRPDAATVSADLGARLLRLARATLRTEIGGTDDLRRALRDLPASARDRLGELQGTFVTLNRTDPREIARYGRLRGCIGQVRPALALPESVVAAAASAALEDPRFRPVRAEELDGLAIELTLLTPPRPIASWKEIELGRHGILLTKDGHRAVFLPQVPIEEGWTIEETLTHLAEKAGLPGGAWREGASLEVFEGQRFQEPVGSEDRQRTAGGGRGR